MADLGKLASGAATSKRPSPAPLPLAVDLDGTLIATDTLAEGLIDIVFRRPGALAALIGAAGRGRAALKRKVARTASVDYALLPYDPDVLALIEARRASGEEVVLVTAADQAVADAVATQLGVFDAAYGSDGSRNLKGPDKAAWLCDRFPGGFAYVGDSSADRAVWAAAGEAFAVAPAGRFKDVRLEGRIDRKGASLREWLRALRVHQWSKNALLFVPLVLSHQFVSPVQDLMVLAGFILFGMVASGTYLINDLSDLAADRAHPGKRARALAAGRIPIAAAAAAAGALIGLGLAGGALLSLKFGAVVLSYTVLTLLYSMQIKRLPLTDVMTIGGLFTIRIVAGMVLANQPISLWLSSFTMMLFTSLAMAKRHAELVRSLRAAGKGARGRGYEPHDESITIAIGVAAAVSAILIMLLYMQFEAASTGLYHYVKALFLAPIVLASWLMRIWIRSHRGLLDEDPVIFALKDKVSWAHAAAVELLWVIAVI